MVHLVDVNARAVASRRNLELNNVAAGVFLGTVLLPARRKYHLILTNPPIRAEKVVYPLVEEAYQRSEPGGRLCLVIRTKQGQSMEKHMAASSARRYLG